MKPIISVDNLGKCYRISHKAADAPTNFREVLAGLPQKLLKGGVRTKSEEFWALDGVSFDIMPGERVGVIGRNGAGKSTLLKLLSRITEPTRGKITLRGRAASLLEVGTGFHPELTGRENIFLNGAILGMSRAEVSKKFDEIVDFAGVEKFLDTPVKRYSSGMFVRLGFAVAAHLEPEILIVDEVLAVGDMSFQKKCLGKMEDVSKGQGRTVLFVSHQMAAVRQLCGRCLLMERGKILVDGLLDEVLPAYVGGNEASLTSVPDLHNQPDDPTIRYLAVRLLQDGIPAANPIRGEHSLELDVEYEICADVEGFRLYADILDLYGSIILRLFYDHEEQKIATICKGKYRTKLSISAKMLGPTSYTLVLYSTIYNIRTCSYPDGLRFPLTVSYDCGFAGPYPSDTFRATLNSQLRWHTVAM